MNVALYGHGGIKRMEGHHIFHDYHPFPCPYRGWQRKDNSTFENKCSSAFV